MRTVLATAFITICLLGMYYCNEKGVKPSVLEFEEITIDSPIRVAMLCTDSTSTVLFSGPDFVFDSVYLGYIYNTQSAVKSDTFFDNTGLLIAPYEALESRLITDGYDVNVGEVCDGTLPIPGTDSLQVTGQVGMNEAVLDNYYIIFHTSATLPKGLYPINYDN